MFDSIRPFLPEELPAVYDRLLADPEFIAVINHIMPGTDINEFAQVLRSCKTNLEVQYTLIAPLIDMLLMRCAKGITLDCTAITDKQTARYTFISNHRDIILDPALLSYLLYKNQFPTTVEIAIGDNLLIRPWIKDLVRVNKSFIVQRSLSMRQMLLASANMSQYMHHAISEKHENLWIAQREGRAKDSNDRTQDSILKMLTLGAEGTIIERLKHLHIVPLAICYEYDPCDYLKAIEFQLKRDIPGWKKSPQDDLTNMQTGIFGKKGRIHFHMAPCIDSWLDTLPPDTPKTEIFTLIAQHIDRQIHLSYRLFPANHIAKDLLQNNNEATNYTPEDKATFTAYLDSQLAKITATPLPITPDIPYLRERILTMYANPAINQQAAK